MEWLFFSVLAVAFWALSNVLDKHVISTHTKNPLIHLFITLILGVIFSLIVFILVPIEVPSSYFLLIFFFFALIQTTANYLFFKSILIDEVSRVIPILLLAPVFVAVMAAVFFNEILTANQYTGIALILIGAFLISLKKTVKMELSKGVILMGFATLLYAITSILSEYFLNYMNYWTVFFWEKNLLLLPLILVFTLKGKAILKTVKELFKPVLLASSSESIAQAADLFFIIALSFGSVSIVSGTTNLQPVFVLIFAVILSIWKPQIIKEEITKTTLIQKIIAIILMITGTILIS
ncbi:MAG: EamA family transporter [Candidatus Diapherotrites archaeon]